MEYPVTTAVRVLREHQISFDPHLYEYKDHGGTTHAAVSLGVDEHAVVKTLVFESDGRKPLLVLMHGDREVSTKQMARFLGVKQVIPCDPAAAQRHTGYMVGGISPFGTRTRIPVYVEATILSLPKMYVNGGKRGFLVSITPAALQKVVQPTEVNVAIQAEGR